MMKTLDISKGSTQWYSSHRISFSPASQPILSLPPQPSPPSTHFPTKHTMHVKQVATSLPVIQVPNACVMCHMYTCPWPNREGRTQRAKTQVLPWLLPTHVTLNKSFYFSGCQFPQWQNGENGSCLGKMGINYIKYLAQCLAHLWSCIHLTDT